jgi:DNA-3-methyladenine glycosylase
MLLAAMEKLEDILNLPVDAAAARLLGCHLEREINGQVVRVKIVETEAYHQSDAASHSYKGKTPRTEVMFGPSGHLYVYFTYGMHYCCNIVTGPIGEGSAVLIRAVEPISGEQIMADSRPGQSGINLTNGPAKLCQALKIDKRMNGHDLRYGSLKLIIQPPLLTNNIVQTTRVGITQAKDVPWRFYIRGNPYASKV